MAIADLAEAAACAHCGLPAPVAAGDSPAFCCPGCRAAYALIHDSGLNGYYALAERRELPVDPSGRGYEELDHAAFEALYLRHRADGTNEVDLYLEGVRCASCVWLVERVPRAVPGCARAELQLHRGVVTVTWDPALTSLSRIAGVLDRLGYRPHPWRGARRAAVRREEDRAMLVRVGIAGALAGNVMMLALALYSGWFTGMDGEYTRFLRWVSMLLTVPIVIGPGSLFFRGAFAALRMRSLHMDVPVAVALAAGFARGAANTVAGAGPIYFDGVATLVFLLLLGRWLQQRAQRSAIDSSELMHALAPATAQVIESGTAGESAREVPVEALLPGALVQVRDGDTLPADGTVSAGRSYADVSFLTGEPRPVAVGPGDRVFAGAVNRGGILRVRVEQAGEASRLGRILAEVEAGASRRAAVVRLADQWSGVFVAVVLALAAVTAVIWWPRDAGAAVDHAIALLIVTCPCALALATPLAVTVAIGRAARAGILIKGGDALEHLSRPSHMLLDKTGTVTEGRSRLVDWRGPESLKPIVLGLERHSSHPLAAGFARAWPEIAPAAVAEMRAIPGAGIEGIVDGRVVFVGAPWQVAGGSELTVSDAAAKAWTPVVVAMDGRVVASAGFADAVRPDAALAIEHLHRRGWTIELLSGDDPQAVAAAAAVVGIARERTRGSASPEDKRAVVEDRLRHGPAIMVGDGINDAPAMAIATAGIGVSGGAEACVAAADVHLARPGLAPLVELVEGSRRTMRVIHRNIAFSIAYNLLGAGLAMAGWMNPLIAAVLMPVSSLTVVLSSRWSRTFDGRTESVQPAQATVPAVSPMTSPEVATAEV